MVQLDNDESEQKYVPASTSAARIALASEPDAAGSARPQRRKARRACAACQRAHLTCGDERPCTRCIKRGLAHNCHDGARKKAKYLYDTPSEEFDPVARSVSLGSPGSPTGTGSELAQTHAHLATGLNHDSVLLGSGPRSLDARPLPDLNPNTPTTNEPGRQNSDAMSGSESLGPIDMSLFDIDIADLNFDNYFGALEFGILGQLSSGAVQPSEDDDPPSPMNTASRDVFPPARPNLTSYNDQLYTKSTMTSRMQGAESYESPLPSASFGAASRDQLQQRSLPQIISVTHKGNSDQTPPLDSALVSHAKSPLEVPGLERQDPARQDSSPFPSSELITAKWRIDPSNIYSSITTPYSYTAGFHALTALLQRRFPAQKTLQIAKALASIRPSFISCTKDLKIDDLIFMEKCLQRTLLQYDDFINAYGCPTLICRRTGEVAAASKEFTQLTGWSDEVLLGHRPNLNANGPRSLTCRDQNGSVLPVDRSPHRIQPVFLAELLDDDSVVQFYEDFAELAFGDPRGRVVRPCKLVKYVLDDGRPPPDARRLDVGCMYCWSVKRDVFDMPMLIVINFLPTF